MKVVVNGIELDLKPGTSAIDAVFAAGHDVPYFCSQEYMSPIGACRLCLAKVGAPRKDRETNDWIRDEETGEPKIFYFPNPMATCTTAIMEGMVIDTLSKEVQQAQSGMMEFTLINHPLDCPVCDKGGACELQDRAYEYGQGTSRFEFDKRHQEKHHALSDLITLDRERCIHCKRCVRYFEEIPGDEVLDFIERGGHTYIGTLEEGLPSNFTGNITDMCPVGALLDTTSRFRGRNWEYDHTRSTCLDCAVGCATTVDARTGRIERVKSGRNTQINNDWICDGGRFGHEYVGADDRLTTPLLRKNGALEPVDWDEATAFIANKLKGMGQHDVGIALRADATLEEAIGATSLADQLGTGQRDHYPRPAASVIVQGTQATLNQVATSDAIFVIGDLTEEAPIVDLRIKEALKGVAPPELMPHGVPIADLRLKERMPRKREILSVAAPYHVDLMNHAGRTVQYGAGREVALLSLLLSAAQGDAQGNVNVDAQKAAELGLSAEQVVEIVVGLQKAKNAVIVYGGFVLASKDAANAAAALAKATDAKVMAVGPMANSYGLEHFSLLPSQAGFGYASMLRGDVKALILSGLDPAQDTEVAETLKGLELLVVHDSFRTATTELADVVLPAKTGFEKSGTVMNLEGRYLSVNPAPVDAGSAEDFTGVVKALGDAIGERLDGRSTRSAHRKLRKERDLDLSELPPEGLLPDVKYRAVNTFVVKDRELPSGNLLLVPSMVRAEQLGRNTHLQAAFGDVALRVNPKDAGEMGLEPGTVVSFSVGSFSRHATIAVTDTAPAGLMLLSATPDQPVGLTAFDPATITVERVSLEMSA